MRELVVCKLIIKSWKLNNKRSTSRKNHDGSKESKEKKQSEEKKLKLA